MKLKELFIIIKNRQATMPDGSYVASLFQKGRDRCIQKVGEEATEVVIAAKNNSKTRQIEELTDLLFHTLILMAQLSITPENIQTELDKRHRSTVK